MKPLRISQPTPRADKNLSHFSAEAEVRSYLPTKYSDPTAWTSLAMPAERTMARERMTVAGLMLSEKRCNLLKLNKTYMLELQ